MSFVKFPKIEQFRNVIYDVKHQFQYTGQDENDIAVYDRTLQLPTIKFTGTVKLHGTNSAIGYDLSKDELWCQKRTSNVVPGKDNAGFALWVDNNKEEFLKALRDLAKPFDIKSLIVYGEWCGCFSYNTPILLADGSKRQIGIICNSKQPVEVMTYNFKTGKLEPKKVINWHNNGNTEDWITIEVKKRKRGGKSTRIVVTPNHNIYIKRNGEIVEVMASEIKIGDEVLIPGDKLSYNMKQFIMGSLLGDASFKSSGNLKISHSIDNQPFYNTFIKNLLHPIISSVSNSVSGYGSNMENILTHSIIEIKEMRDEIYNKNNNKPTKKYLNKLHPIALATWYMDDGSIIINKHDDNSTRQYQCELSTLGYDYDTNCVIRDWFNEHGYECYINTIRKLDSDKYNIRFTPNGSISFLSVVAPYIIDGFNYKLPEELQNIPKYDWENKLSIYEESLLPTPVVSVKNGSPYKEDWKKTRYDIEVEDNHNYFANNILVHNSNIQKNVAISGLDKMFVIFAIRLVYKANKEEYESGERYEFIDPRSLRDLSYQGNESLSKIKGKYNIKGLYDSFDFQTFEIEVDFARPDLAQNEMVKMVQAVEDECPVGKALGRKLGEDNTTGEGIVWTGGWDKGSDRHFIFKTKGEKHSVSKVKKIAEIDTVKMDSIHEFVDYAVTGNRLNQGMQEAFGEEIPTVKGTGDFLRWIIKDIMDEEADVLEKNNLVAKDVNKFVSTKARIWFMKQLDAKAGI